MTAGYTHYLLELFAYMLVTYLVGCLLGASWRKLFATEPVPAYVAPASTAAEPHVPVAPVALAEVDTEQSAKRVAAAMGQDAGRPSKPKGLSAARGSKPDDLQRISGIGPKNEKVLHSLGFFHFDQIAAWTAAEVNWVDDHLNFNGRIAREEWIAQARLLADGKTAEFARLYGTGGQKGTDGEARSGSRTRKG